MAIEFLNADLELYSQTPLESIHKEFMSQGYRFEEMHAGKIFGEESFLYSYEIQPDCTPDGEVLAEFEGYKFSAEEKIIAFIHAIRDLGEEAANEWKQTDRRIIDLGYKADNHCSTLSDTLSHKTLNLMSKYSIDLVLTYYPEVINNDA